MQIQSSGSTTVSPAELRPTDQTPRAAGTAGTSPATEMKSSFKPTSNLADLLAAVKQLPDVRAEVVQDVSARVARGELSTPAAAHDAAQAAVGDLRQL